MWFDPQSLVSSASPPATFATSATFQADGAAKVAESQKSQTPTSENQGPKVAESQKSQGPSGCFPEIESRTENPATTTPTPEDARKVGEVLKKATRHVLRVERFSRLGLPAAEAEALAERLALRDRDFDHRTACAECANLHGRPGGWRCGNWRQADVGGPAIPAVFVAEMLQHCRGFRAASQMISVKVSEGGF